MTLAHDVWFVVNLMCIYLQHGAWSSPFRAWSLNRAPNLGPAYEPHITASTGKQISGEAHCICKHYLHNSYTLKAIVPGARFKPTCPIFRTAIPPMGICKFFAIRREPNFVPS